MTIPYSLNLFIIYMTVVRDKCCVVRLIVRCMYTEQCAHHISVKGVSWAWSWG